VRTSGTGNVHDTGRKLLFSALKCEI